MKRLLVVMLIVATCSVFVAAQAVNDGTYSLTYYSNRNTYDSTVRIINPGTQGTPLTPKTEGAICADLYVFDAQQEMIECCACPITANGLLTLSVVYDLTHIPLTGLPAPATGVIKMVSDDQANCDPTAPAPVPELLGWATHVQDFASQHAMTEEEFSFAPLTADEQAFLGQACAFVQYLGSGKGVCTCGD